MKRDMIIGPSWRAALVLASLAIGATNALARMAAHPPTSDGSASDEAPLTKHEDPHAEMERLFKQIEQRQREIDELLGRASESGRSGRSELAAHLKASESRSRDVVTDIDRILKLAGHAHSGTGT